MADKPEKKRGLGRGLSALMADVAPEQAPQGAAPSANAQTLPLELIQPNPDQPRKTFDAEELEDLANSIREKGIIQPLIVRAMGDKSYQIVAGERRWRAAQMAQLHDVPVVIREFSDVEVLEIAIIENIQRADLNPIEEALGFRHLMHRFNHTQSELSKVLGKSRSHIANLVRLLQLPDDVVELVQTGALSAGHARALVPADNASELAKQIVAKGLSVRDTEKLVKAATSGSGKNIFKDNAGKPSPEKDADTRALEGDLSAALKMKVSLAHEPGTESGKLTIAYTSMDQLDELCQLLSRT